MKCRVFKEKYIWSETLYLIPLNITFIELKDNSYTSLLNKDNYLCSSEFEDVFLNKLNKKYINNKIYYYL